VVEDEEPIAHLLRRLLEIDGHKVDVAVEGAMALRLLKEHSYDLIISDVKMPGMGGQEFYRRVQATAPEMTHWIIFTTGDVISAGTQAFLRETGSPYLSKPFDLEQVRELVNTLLEARI